MSGGRALPGARRPSPRWYLAMARLVAARLLERVTPAGCGKLFKVLSLVMAIRLVATLDSVMPTHDGPAPQQAIVAWVLQLIILAVSAIISAAMTPKPKPPEPVTAQAPVVEDGTGIEIICGTVWMEDEIVLGFKEILPRQKIRAQGGKKG